MRYVTEDELREAYAKAPFGTYELPDDARLTPGARQFLIDFRVDFDSGEAARPPKAHGRAARSVRGTDPCDLGALVHDANLLGARLRLLARRSLGIDNAVARRAEALGRRWQEARTPADLVADQPKGDVTAEPPGPPPAPAFDAAMHPAFFEMAYVHAQLGRYARAWDNARDAARPEDARTIGAWVSEAALLCKELEESVARAEGEV
ncbi:MAG: hypothetical protein MSA61_10655 [Coriobacteriaceae bacterium]|uniref:hypothetical protein n=1 Tax=Tractidigestivibacter sp. TaxID=2847320 RepID=UPI002A83A729|nr:hypothetical protein [Tractidigestivibacter sp.]MCI7439666.1 hypothetical protein [Coriobacteriaceae bacterium]MDY4534895.1 hypothetical protein [Tractidigestivibacter sp.]